MTTDPLAQLVVALVVELRTVVRDEVRAAMATRAPTEVMSVREAASPGPPQLQRFELHTQPSRTGR